MAHVFLSTNVTNLYYFQSMQYLHVILKKDVEYSLEKVMDDFKIIHELKKDQEINILINMLDITFEYIPKEVLSYLANNPYTKFQKKSAVVVSNTAHMLIGNVYIASFKPKSNTKLFKSFKSAFKWFGYTNYAEKIKEIEFALQHKS